ncbi:protein of unknown function [Prosthecobacter debontii]|uniref:3-keto-alpha-glucoside-1,2-lyase/3-keto-2-hydroxy-glucal hydratase domain-containing protein n=1 Tax=Prosthecobacter debontii TaxID=48467 RepID=A0A1T4WVI4_9BACT|nr:DUF1080 domain-containing protein [Prosthecobacter debontii]SKA81137.1 protein of unknown function [Prosthecobacter debontii]
MFSRALLFLPLISLLGLTSCQPKAEQGFVPMFHANDLHGWVNANCAPETWSIKDGVISCTGFPTGALRTEKQYENFILEAEWRHLTEAGNSGIFVWGTPISSPGVPFLRGIEVQILDHGYMKKADPKKPKWFTTHGDVFPIHGATMAPHGEHNGQRSFPSEERSKPSPEWNHYRIEANNGRITLAVNGKVVSGGDNCNYRKGYLALESEGAPVEFRNVRIKELPSTNAVPEVTAPLDQGWKALYTGLDFRHWIKPAAGGDKWTTADWQIKVAASQTGPALWSEESFGDCEIIADINLPKGTDLTKPAAGLCVRGLSHPLVMFGQGKASIVLGPDQVKAGQWYRVKATLKGKTAQVLITEPKDENPQTFEVTVDMGAQGRIGLADLTQAVSYSNIYVRELEASDPPTTPTAKAE